MAETKLKTVCAFLAVPCLIGVALSLLSLAPTPSDDDSLALAAVVRRSYAIDVHTVGELEAARSISIASSIRTDQPKVIDLIADGVNVNTGDLLVKIDPSPFEKKIEELEAKHKECEAQLAGCKHALAWEIDQAKHEEKTATFEMEVAELELNKVIKGDGPLEIARLKAAMQKAKTKFDDLNNYSDDLVKLEKEGFLNPTELRQTQKKLQEEKESYENALLQYESFVEHVHPVQIKKAQTSVKRLVDKQEETARTSKFKIAKAQSALTQSEQQLLDLKRQLREARYELTLTEIRAPSPGMVVQREEYRSSQRRKPRVGDILVRNQPILDLPDLSSMTVKTKVRELDLYKVEIGKPATVEVDAYPHLLFEGEVTFIGILALPDMMRPGDEKHFEVKVALKETDPRLRPGMTARVLIHAGDVQDALSVPIHAVFEFDKTHCCFVADKAGYRKQPVEIGMNNEQWVEILQGLDESDRVTLSLPPHFVVMPP